MGEFRIGFRRSWVSDQTKIGHRPVSAGRKRKCSSVAASAESETARLTGMSWRQSDPVPLKRLPIKASSPIAGYDSIVSELIDLVESARRVSARAVNSIMTATYWEIGRRIVESEQKGRRRAGYGEALLKNLAFDLTAKFGRGFGLANLKNIRKFYLTWPIEGSIGQTASDQSASQRIDPSSDEKGQTLSGLSKGGQGLARLRELAGRFPLPWSHYVRLLPVSNLEPRHTAKHRSATTRAAQSSSGLRADAITELIAKRSSPSEQRTGERNTRYAQASRRSQREKSTLNTGQHPSATEGVL